jgi:folate-binding protein YgfZ
MSDAAERAAAVRRGAGLFRSSDRALLAVRGADRVRWLDGMLSNEIARLQPGPERSGCYAFLLSPQGRILADVHVLERGEELWLESDAQGFDALHARLERFVVADDVTLAPADGLARLALEGPAAPDLLARVLGRAPALAPECGGDFACAGVSIVVAAWGSSGAPGFQLFVPRTAADAVADAIARAARPGELVTGDAEVLEILRIEAGVPRMHRELNERVLPPELGAAVLQRAVSSTKGCYTGQEIVARLVSRDAAAHRLVALRFGSELPAAGAELRAGGKAIGEVTSVCRSALAGAIGLGFVRRPFDAAGTALDAAGHPAQVARAPVVPLA